MANVATQPPFAPPRAAKSPITPSPERPTPPPAVEVVGGGQRPLQQISEAQREELLRQLDGHITPESVWLRAYNAAPDATAFGRARLREQRAEAA